MGKQKVDRVLSGVLVQKARPSLNSRVTPSLDLSQGRSTGWIH